MQGDALPDHRARRRAGAAGAQRVRRLRGPCLADGRQPRVRADRLRGDRDRATGSRSTPSACTWSTTRGRSRRTGCRCRPRAATTRTTRCGASGCDVPNLGGTARTLDDVDGAVPLENGVLAFNGVALVDDSTHACCSTRTAGSRRAPRAARTSTSSPTAATTSGHCRRSTTLTGPTPLLPRYALGNWWSRYHPYTAEEYVDLVDRFRGESVPLSVAVIDMDWHWVDIDPKYGSGWTGYTWNTDLFPDPQAVPRRPARARPRGLAQRAPGRGRPRPRGVLRRDGASGWASTPTTEMPVGFDLDRPGVRRGLLRGAAPPARGPGRRLLVARLAAGRRHKDRRDSTRCGCSTTCTTSTPARDGRRAADVLPLRRASAATATRSGSPATRTSPGSHWTSSRTSPPPRPTPATAGGATTSAATSRATRTTSSPPVGCSSASSPR